MLFFDLMIVSLVVGAGYSIMAISYSLIFASIRLLHFAQGDFLMLGGYMALTFVSTVSDNIFVVLALTMITLSVFGGLLERFSYRKIPYDVQVSRIIATL